jgi:hypothetical protein
MQASGVATIVEVRLEAVRQQLVAGHRAGAALSSATKGNERELLVGGLLEEVFPPSYRFGTGDIVDSSGTRTGQLDLVVEYPFAPSFPALGGGPRLYVAEGVAAVAEVKSDLAGQRDQVVETARKVRALVPKREEKFIMGAVPKSIPFFAIGFQGWKTIEGAAGLLAEGVVDGIYEIEPARFSMTRNVDEVIYWNGPHAMVVLVNELRRSLTRLLMADPSLMNYLSPKDAG